MLRFVMIFLLIMTTAEFIPQLVADQDGSEEVGKCLALLLKYGCTGRLSKEDCQIVIDSSINYLSTFKQVECETNEGKFSLRINDFVFMVPCSRNPDGNAKHVTYRQLLWLDIVFKYESPDNPEKHVAFVPASTAPGWYEKTFPKDYWMVSTYKATAESGSIARNICLLQEHCNELSTGQPGKMSACHDLLDEAKSYYIYTYGPLGDKTPPTLLALPCVSSFPQRLTEWTSLALNDQNLKTVVMALENFPTEAAQEKLYMSRVLNVVGARQVLTGW